MEDSRTKLELQELIFMEVARTKLKLQEMIEELKQENAENEGKPLTFQIEYRKLLQWLFEKHLEAESIPFEFNGGLDSGEQEIFKRKYQREYRDKLRQLKQQYKVD